MSKPFDASPKALLQYGPADWPAFLGVQANSVEIMDADLSTVTAATDKVLLIHAAEGDSIQHYDFQAGPDTSLPRRVYCYSALLENQHDLPVESIVILLARKAKLRSINGKYERTLPGSTKSYVRFHYRLIRVWEISVEQVLNAGVSVLPLAPISKVGAGQLPVVIERMKERFAKVRDQAKVAELWTATKVLMGLKYDKVLTERLLQGVRTMKESVTYQAIVEEGRLEGRLEGRQEGRQEGKVQEARRILLRIGTDRFNGPPSPEHLQQLEAITDAGHLEDLAVRVLHVGGWSELLGAPTTPRPRRRKKT